MSPRTISDHQAVAALEIIDARGCESFTAPFSCFVNNRTAVARYGADLACAPCVAHQALAAATTEPRFVRGLVHESCPICAEAVRPTGIKNPPTTPVQSPPSLTPEPVVAHHVVDVVDGRLLLDTETCEDESCQRQHVVTVTGTTVGCARAAVAALEASVNEARMNAIAIPGIQSAGHYSYTAGVNIPRDPDNPPWGVIHCEGKDIDDLIENTERALHYARLEAAKNAGRAAGGVE